MLVLKEKWSWNKELLRFFLIIPTVLGILFAVVFYFYVGINSLWFLCSILVGAMLRLIYGVVGKRVDQLKEQFSNDPGEVVDALTVIQKIESPGIAILRNDELVIINILKRRATIPLDKIKILREGHMLPGKHLLFKRAFILNASFKNRLAFAVAASVGERWSQIFAGK